MTQFMIPQEAEVEADDVGFIAELNHTGDIKYTWNRKNEAEVAAAEEHFKAMKAKGFLVFKVSRVGLKGKEVAEFSGKLGGLIFQAGTKSEVAQTFDPKASYVATPPAVGG